MEKDNQERLNFLNQQLEWSKEQIRVLDEIEEKLNEMKRIAQYALENELSTLKAEKLNTQMNDMKTGSPSS